MIETARLILRPWQDADRPAFAAINGDPQVGDWLGGAIDGAASDALMDRLSAEIAEQGFGFWAAERKADGAVVGMIGLRRPQDAPPAPCVEMGWRLAASAWGQGLATEGAAAALAWGFARLDVGEILAWTAASNLRSQAVMRRIGMAPDPARDFDHPKLPAGHPLLRHVVFAAKRPAPSQPVGAAFAVASSRFTISRSARNAGSACSRATKPAPSVRPASTSDG